VTAAVTVDVNVFVAAVVGGHDAFHSWPSPPPVRGNLAANVVGILNDAREFSLFLTEHILANVLRVLTEPASGGYGWAVEPAEEYIELLVEIADASGGGVVEPADTDLLSMFTWRGTPVVTSADFVKRTDAMRRARRR
jgi:hypothetical protein